MAVYGWGVTLTTLVVATVAFAEPLDVRGASPDEGLRFEVPAGAQVVALDRGIGVRLGDRYDSPMVAVTPVRVGQDPVAQARRDAPRSTVFPLVKVHDDTADLFLWETKRPDTSPNHHFVAVVELPAYKATPARRIQCDNRGLGTFTLASARALVRVCRSVKPHTVLPPPPETAPALVRVVALGDLPKTIGVRRFDGVSLRVPEESSVEIGLGTALKWRGKTMLITRGKGRTIAIELAKRRKSINRPEAMIMQTERAAIWRARGDRAYHMRALAEVGDVALWCSNITPLTRTQAEVMVAICLSAH